MPVQFIKNKVVVEDVASVEEAENLLEWLQKKPVANIAVRLRVKKKVQNLNAMWYKEFAKNFATQGDFGHESP